MALKQVLGLVIVAACLIMVYGAFGFGGDKVRLEDIQVLTLKSGQMTNGRRSSPVPQLNCVGGTAGCAAFRPQVVQCYNRGSDGYDIQWECKTDMDNAYRFGKVEVTCEGYSHPDDPYVLKGSCGLEYTLDLTKEGHQQQYQGHYDYYEQHQQQQQQQQQRRHDLYGYGYSSSYSGFSQKASSVTGDLIVLGIIAIVIYAIYKTCLASNHDNGSTDPNRRDRWGNERRQPPPPGFREEYMPRDEGCSSSYTDHSTYTGTRGGTNTGGGGFWTGAATGGILGYLFGNRNNYYGSRTYASPYNQGWGTGWGNGWSNGWGTGWGNSWGRGWNSSPRHTSGFSSSSSFGGSSNSTGTRTASGFGGTKRR